MLDEFSLLFAGGDQLDAGLRPYHLQGMGVEGDGHAGALVPVGSAHHLAEEVLMAEVDTIKVADGDMRFREGLGDVVKVCIDFHNALLSDIRPGHNIRFGARTAVMQAAGRHYIVLGLLLHHAIGQM